MSAAAWIVAPLMAVNLMLPFGGRAHRLTEQGNQAFLEGRTPEALRFYTEAQAEAPDAPELIYNIGNVLYEEGRMEDAAASYEQALRRAAGGELEADAAFNLGNARYRLRDYEGAVEAYRRSLELRPDDMDAKINLELALRKLEESRSSQPQRRPGSEGPSSQQEQEDRRGHAEGEPKGSPEPRSEPQSGETPSPPGESAPPPPASQGEPPDSGEPGEPSGRPDRAVGLDPETAARILESVAEQEKDVLRRRLRSQSSTARRVEKDW